MSFAGLLNSLVISVLLAFAATSSVAASTLRLAWSPSSSPEVVEYRVYTGILPGVYTASYSASNLTNFNVTNLIAGTTYHFAVTAVNRAGVESEFSSPVSGIAPVSGAAVTGLITGGSFEVRLQGAPAASYLVEESQDLRQWTTVVSGASDSQGRLVFRSQADRPRSFFRVRPQ